MLNALNSYRLEKHRTTRFGTLGFVHNWPVESFAEGHLPPMYKAYFRGAAAQAEALGFMVEEFSIGEAGTTAEEVQRTLDKRGIQAVVIAPLHPRLPGFELTWKRLSAVALGLSLKNMAIHHVGSNQFQAMRTCVSKLVESGHRRPALFLTTTQDNRSNNAYSGAFFASCIRLLGGIGPYLMPPKRFPEGEEAFKNWIERERPDSLVILEPYPLWWLKEMGIKVPDDISIVSPAGLSVRPDEADIIKNLHMLDEVAHVREDVLNIGSVAARVAIRMLHQNEFGESEPPQSILLDGEWVPGPSIKKRGN
jgi:DNA-binding LacI/PurR family transcriptional regulator